jgi:hypothetical protein
VESTSADPRLVPFEDKIAHEDWIAAIEFKRVNLFPCDQLLDGGRFRLQSYGRRRYFDSLARGAYGKLHVDAQMSAGLKLVLNGLVFLKTRSLDGYGVEAGRKIGDRVEAGFVCDGLALNAGLIVHEDFGSSYGRT